MGQVSFQIVSQSGGELSGQQVVIWVSDIPKTPTVSNDVETGDLSPDNGFRPIFVGISDGDGLVPGLIPEGPFGSAIAKITGTDESAPIALVDNEFPDTAIILVGSLPAREKDRASEELDELCCFSLQKRQAFRQHRFTQIVIVEQPKVAKFEIVEPPRLKVEEQKKAADARKQVDDYWKQIAAIPVKTLASATVAMQQRAAKIESSSATEAAKAPTDRIIERPVDPKLPPDRPEIAQRPSRTIPDFASGSIMSAALPSVDIEFATIATDLLAEAVKDIPPRYMLDCDEPLDWDITPTIVQACQPYLLHVLQFTQEVVHAGYMEGSIAGTVTLLPCQEKQIATVTFRRDERNSRSEQVTAVDRLSNELTRARDVDELQKSTLQEASRGGSKSHVASVSASASFPLLGGAIGVSGGYSQSGSSSFQNSSRNLAAESSQRLMDSTQQAAESIRSQTVSVMHAVSQEESVTATTEVIKNHNKTRSLELISYEIHNCFDIRQRLTHVSEAIAVPLRISIFDESKVLRWEEALRDTLQNRALLPAFDAIKRIQTEYNTSHVPNGAYADATVTEIEGVIQVECRIEAPDFSEFNSFGDFEKSISGQPLWIRGNSFFYSRMLSTWNQAIEKRREYWRKEVAPRMAADAVRLIKVSAITENGGTPIDLQLDATVLTQMNSAGMIEISFSSGLTVPPLKRSQIYKLQFSLADDIGNEVADISKLLPGKSQIIIQNGHFEYQTDFSTGSLFRNGRIRKDMSEGDSAIVSTPLSTEEKRNPRFIDIELRNDLLHELNTNIVAYHEAIYHFMAMQQPSQLRMLMDRVLVKGTESDPSIPETALSVRTISGDYVGTFDGCVAFQIAPGYSLSADRMNSELLENLPQLANDSADGDSAPDDPAKPPPKIVLDLMAIYKPPSDPEPLRVTLPTGSTYTKASLGKCLLSEEIDHSLNVRWLEPCDDEPTAINPVSTESRRAEPTDLSAKDLSQPIINLQNAPAAPEFGGTSAILGAIANPDVFRDMTGLSATQNAALQAYLKSQGSADSALTGAVEIAVAKIAQKEQEIQNIDKIGNRIGKAVSEGWLSKEDAKKIVKKQFENSIESGDEASKMESEFEQDLKEINDILDDIISEIDLELIE